MSRRASVGVHAAAKSSAATVSNRRYLGWLLVLGLVFFFATPAAQANDGDPLIAGYNNSESTVTLLQTNSSEGLIVFSSVSDASSAALSGEKYNAGNGVRGFSGLGNGVFGDSASSTASGVYGFNDNGGYGVAGRVSNGGVAVLADTPDGTGTALLTTGKLEFQKRSGIAVIPSGAKSKTVTQPGVTASSMVLATVQNSGGYFASAVPAAGSIKIYLNKAPVSPATVKVAWLVLN